MSHIFVTIVMIFVLAFLYSMGGAIIFLFFDNPTPEHQRDFGIAVFSALALVGITMANNNKNDDEDS